MQELSIFIVHHLALTYALVGVLLALVIVEGMRLRRNTRGLTVSGAVALMNHEQAVIVDLRAKDAFQDGHIIHALSLPKAPPSDLQKIIEKNSSKPVILVCGEGRESQTIVMRMQAHHPHLHYLLGGMRAWRLAQMPTHH